MFDLTRDHGVCADGASFFRTNTDALRIQGDEGLFQLLGFPLPGGGPLFISPGVGHQNEAGYAARATVIADVDPSMRIIREEVFGPVLTVEQFSTEDEAVALANDTTYGLAGAVWTADAGRAQRVAGRLRHGTIWFNDYNVYVPQAEWGGFKQSGIGRELGPTGLDEYREAKHIWQNTRPGPTGWFGG